MSDTNVRMKDLITVVDGQESDNNIHIAIFEKKLLKKVLSGEKRLESRFSKNRIAPYDVIENGDIIFLKETSGPIVAKAKAGIIKFFSHLSEDKVDLLRMEFQSDLCADEGFWEKKRSASFGTIIFLQDVKVIEPFNIEKRDRRPWVVLGKHLKMDKKTHNKRMNSD